MFAHELVLVDEAEHEDEDDGEKDAVEDLGEDAELDEWEVRDEDNACPSGDEQAVKPVEKLRLAEALVQTTLEAEALADGVGGGQGEDGCGEERGIEEAGGEEDEGVLAGQGLHGSGGVGWVGEVADAVGVEGGGAGDDDEPGDDVGKDGADDDIEAGGLVLADRDPLLDDGGLQVELHPGGDGGADDADGHVEVGLVVPDAAWGELDGLDEGEVPVGAAEHAGDDVGDVEDAGDEEDLLDALVVALDDEDPDDGGTDGDAGVFADVEELHAAGDSGELRDHVGEVHDDEQDHDDEGDAEAELFADEIAETFAGDHPHAGAHLLNDDEGEGDGDHRPEEGVAVLGSGGRVGEDAAGVVVDVGGDEAWTEHGKEEDEPGSPGAPGSHFLDPFILGGERSARRS